MSYTKREYAYNTSVTQSYPWGLFVRADVMCSDGKVRAVARIAETADTVFSVPAAVRVAGKYVSGYMTVETRSGSSVATEDDPAVAKFARYDWGRNADLLPGGFYRPSNSEGE